MQFRAEVLDDGSRRIVLLAGRLELEQSPEIVRICSEAQTPVRLDLTDLVSVDAVGLETLLLLESRGAELVGVSPYLALRLEAGRSGRTRALHGDAPP